MEYDKLDIGENSEDKFIYLLIKDTEFLKQAQLRGLEPKFFSTEVRQRVVGSIFDYFEKYGKSPDSDLLDSIFGKLKRKVDAEDFASYYDDRLMTDIASQNVSKQFLLDGLDEFVKRRVIFTTINELNKKRNRLTSSPQKLLDIMRQCVNRVERTSPRGFSLYTDSQEELVTYGDDILTCFNIPEIDKPLGGGLYPGQFVVLQGYTGRGKSWTMAHLAGMGTMLGSTVYYVPNEMDNSTLRLRLMMMYNGWTKEEALAYNRPFKSSNTDGLPSLDPQYGGSNIIIMDDEEKNTPVNRLPKLVENAEVHYGKKINLILLDSADDFLPPEGERYYKAQEKSTAIYTFLKNWAKSSKKCVVTTSQSQRIGETKEWLGSSNIGDDINKVRKATLGISINAKEYEVKAEYLRFWIFKYTDGRTGSKCWVKTNLNRGQLVQETGRYEKEKYKQMVAEMKKLT